MTKRNVKREPATNVDNSRLFDMLQTIKYLICRHKVFRMEPHRSLDNVTCLDNQEYFIVNFHKNKMIYYEKYVKYFKFF